MVELVEQINTIGWGNVVLCFFLIVCVIIAVVATGKKLMEALGLKTIRSLKEEEFEKKLKNLQTQIDETNGRIKQYQESIVKKQEEYHQQSIEIRGNLADKQDGLKDDIKSVKELLQQFMCSQNETTVAMLRSSLWKMHKEFVTQGFTTPDGLKTFMEMGKVYEAAGGDDIYHEKLLPEVESLMIHYPDGSIYNPITKSIE